jgi:hypothetical protein
MASPASIDRRERPIVRRRSIRIDDAPIVRAVIVLSANILAAVKSVSEFEAVPTPIAAFNVRRCGE